MKLMIASLISAFAFSTLTSSAALASVHVGPACTPGTWGLVEVPAKRSRTAQVVKLCLPNGRYFADAKNPTYRVPQEGSETFFTVQNANGHGSTEVLYVVRNGKWVPKFPSQVPEVANTLPAEGAVTSGWYTWIDSSGRSHSEPAEYIFINGAWVRIAR